MPMFGEAGGDVMGRDGEEEGEQEKEGKNGNTGRSGWKGRDFTLAEDRKTSSDSLATSH